MFKWITALLMVSVSASAPASTIGVGIAQSDQPALSVHWGQTFIDAFHLTTHYSAEQASLTADYQRFYVPDFGFGYHRKLGFYTGGGLRGEVQSDTAHEESYFLRLPVGVQIDFHAMHVQVFAEGVAMLGALPRTSLVSGFTAGVRAQF